MPRKDFNKKPSTPCGLFLLSLTTALKRRHIIEKIQCHMTKACKHLECIVPSNTTPVFIEALFQATGRGHLPDVQRLVEPAVLLVIMNGLKVVLPGCQYTMKCAYQINIVKAM